MRGKNAFFELLIYKGEDYDLSYEVGPYKVLIKEAYPPVYMPRIDLETLQMIPRLRNAINKIENSFDDKLRIERIDLDSVLKSLEVELRGEIGKHLDGRSVIEKMARMGALEVLKLSRLGAFLLDHKVEEFFIDGWNSEVYLTHSDYGRMISDVVLTNEEITALMTHLQVYSGRDITEDELSLKTELRTESFHFRVNLDVEPLSVDGPCFSFRNLRRRFFTIVDLIKNGTLSAEAAAFLMLAAWTKQSMVIIGEPGSGKTTLMNSLDITLPSHWRKIYIEDVVESVNQRSMGKLQTRYRVKTLDEGRSSKEIQSLLSLHRSPDYFILGEILTKDHSKALFEALSSGLKGIGTFHSDDVRKAIARWREHHGVPDVCLEHLDLLVHMREFEARKPTRRVIGIFEVGGSGSPLSRVFSYNFDKDKLEWVRGLRDTSTIERAAQYLRIRLDEVTEMFGEIKEKLAEISLKEGLDRETITKEIDRVYRDVVRSRMR